MRDRDPIRPRPDKPEVPTPPPTPKPAPKAPETPKPTNPQPEQKTPVPVPVEQPSWKKTCLQLAAAFGAGAVVGKLFLPGWVVLIMEAIKQILTAIGGS